MKYSLALIALAASALAAPALTPRDPQRGRHGNHGSANQPVTAPATTPVAAAQNLANPSASQVNPGASQPTGVPTAAAANPAGSAAATTGGPIPDNLVPQFGVTPGIPDPNQAGSCLGFNNAVIPCFCPPPRDQFIDRLNEIVAAGQAFGHPAQFPTDDSAASQAARLNALTVTMQNFNNTASGVGCPKAAANFQ